MPRTAPATISARTASGLPKYAARCSGVPLQHRAAACTAARRSECMQRIGPIGAGDEPEVVLRVDGGAEIDEELDRSGVALGSRVH